MSRTPKPPPAPPPPIDPLQVYTPQQAGYYSQLGLGAVNALMEDGRLPFAFKPPGQRYRLILGSDLLDALRGLRAS